MSILKRKRYGSIRPAPEASTELIGEEQTLEVVTNKWSKEIFCFENTTYTGGSFQTAILQPDDFVNNQSFVVDFYMTAIQTSATAGDTAIGMKVRAMFRKNNAGTLVQVGASTQEWVLNDTGDSFTGTPS
ncbi:MAG: hypothetical protein WBO32_16515, partial [Cyclobacteriaceae bacterium]